MDPKTQLKLDKSEVLEKDIGEIQGPFMEPVVNDRTKVSQPGAGVDPG
jgi:hypothetical protein